MNQLLQKFKGHILTALVAIVIGVILGFIFDKPKTTFVAGETKIEYRDTCVLDRIIADVITESNTTQTGGVKKGKVQKETSTFPVTQVSVQDTDVVTTFSKFYNTGLMKMKVTATVTSKSVARAKIDMEYELDTVTLKEMTTIVNTVVVSKDSVDRIPTEVIKYLPYAEKSSGAYLGLVGGIDYTKGIDYTAGIQLAGERVGLVLYTYPTNWKHVGIQLNTKLFKLKK